MPADWPNLRPIGHFFPENRPAATTSRGASSVDMTGSVPPEVDMDIAVNAPYEHQSPMELLRGETKGSKIGSKMGIK